MLEQSIHSLINRPLLRLPPDALLSTAVAMMDQHHVSCILICESHKPMGIVTDRDLTHLISQHALHSAMTVAEVMAHPVVAIHDNCSYFDVMEYFREHRIRHLVLLNPQGEVSGVVTETDVVNTLETIELLARIPVSDVMSEKIVVSVTPESTLREAIDQMNRLNIGSIVVAYQGKPVGILTEGDIPSLLTRGVNLDTRIDAAIFSEVPVISHALTSYEALHMLRKDRHHHLVVVNDDGSMLGVLSRSDFTKGLVKQHIDELQRIIERQQNELVTAKLELAAMKQQEAEDRYLALLNTANDAIISMDDRGIIIEWNPAAERMFGYSREQASGCELADLILPASLRERHRSGLRKHLETGKSSSMGKIIMVNGIHADGKDVPVELTIARVQTNDATLFTAFLRDITERKRNEQKLHKRGQQLSHLANASRHINSVLKTSRIMRSLMDEAISMVNAESGAAGTFTDGRMRFREYVKGNQRMPIDMEFGAGYGVPG